MPSPKAYMPSPVCEAKADSRMMSFEKKPENGKIPASARLPIHMST